MALIPTEKMQKNAKTEYSRTFFLSFHFMPDLGGVVDSRIRGGLAACWVVEDDPNSAYLKALYRLKKYGCRIERIEETPVEVTLAQFNDRDLGKKCFLEAQEFGIATFLTGYSDAEDLQTKSPQRLPVQDEFPLSEYLELQRTVRKRGLCLHYGPSHECDDVINAHSIQKSGALSLIAQNRHVYSASTSYRDIVKSGGKITFTQTHINSMSTFRGMCGYHDNLLFEAIDNNHLLPTEEQVFLYAYRWVLRETYVTQCSFEILDTQLKDFTGTAATQELLKDIREGRASGLRNLRRLKSQFDDSHKARRFTDIRYVVFESKTDPNAVFSGGLYPDWGFGGEPIQDLLDTCHDLGLITFSFAPMANGWGFLFAWHKIDDEVCGYFISTLQAAVRANRSIGDLLFRLVLKGCENMAFSPKWFENQSEEDKDKLAVAMTYGADMLKYPDSNYLGHGCDVDHGWVFDTVVNNLKNTNDA